MLDVAPALVTRGREQSFVVLDRQQRRKQADRRERHGSVVEMIENDRKPVYGSHGFDTTVGRVFRQMERLGAVVEQRGETLAEIQSPAVDFRQRYDGEGMLQRFRDELILPYVSTLRRFSPLAASPVWPAQGVAGLTRPTGGSAAQQQH